MHERKPIVPPTILVVEDSPDDAMVVGLTFQEAGITNPLEFLEDGEAALQYLLGQGQYADRAAYPLPALLILDLNLPKVDGFGVLETTRGIRAEEGIGTVVLSTSDSEFDRRTALALGADQVMRKPIDPGMLMELVSNIGGLSLLLVPTDFRSR